MFYLSAIEKPVFILKQHSMETKGSRELKKLIKEALIEVLDERKDILQEMIGEAIEDIALREAIKDGRKSKLVSREAIFKKLSGEK